MIIITLFISTFLLGIMLHAFEYNDDRGVEHEFEFVWNSFWVVILTMTTVGYGDIYPTTHLGRFVTVIACFIGAVVLTLLVNAMTNTLDMKNHEKEVSRQIQKYDDIDRYLRNDAKIIVAAYLRRAVLKRSKITNKNKNDNE